MTPAGGSVLDLLAARYGTGATVREIPPEVDGVVRAMPVILRIERDPQPSRTALLQAAATAALAVCLDPRAQEGGEWDEPVRTWVDGRIRKIARRARGAHWDAVQELPGVTVGHGTAQARALLPGPVDDVPKTVSRLQIGGTDLGTDTPGPPPDGWPLIVLNPHAETSVGKAAAQVGHASMILAAVRGWTSVPEFAVRDTTPGGWDTLLDDVEGGRAVAVRDAGFTEVDPGTITCVAMDRPDS
ncbi:peptidyl-tRNA hydrolase [Pseudonocardia sp. KRD291]|uniref:peptidyl-tRNA hydrolase n=1 Tax=Pseudonocardia sp. KRD291 TaxID=2792007 RepID=UPI001C49EFD7|nr:peptidyl-tRNA hydrolase [Pseudonocardia sp. KRD291]MBW0105934.1 peptidyl-tRNA hydrolase [Pseudonocardia sp. KRD291]